MTFFAFYKTAFSVNVKVQTTYRCEIDVLGKETKKGSETNRNTPRKDRAWFLFPWFASVSVVLSSSLRGLDLWRLGRNGAAIIQRCDESSRPDCLGWTVVLSVTCSVCFDWSFSMVLLCFCLPGESIDIGISRRIFSVFHRVVMGFLLKLTGVSIIFNKMGFFHGSFAVLSWLSCFADFRETSENVLGKWYWNGVIPFLLKYD